jgi:hypothetical protein
MDGRLGEPPRVQASVLGQPKNDIRKREAGRLYGLWTAADAWSDPLPGNVERLPKCLQLVWSVGHILDKSARSHSGVPQRLQSHQRWYSFPDY